MIELTFPRVMMVSDEPITSKNPGQQRVVWAHNPKFYYPFFPILKYVVVIMHYSTVNMLYTR